MSINIPRPEYPRPQFVRPDWINLNGKWEYMTDRAGSGHDRGLNKPDAVFTEEITVPFCRESELSGINDKDFCNNVWYRKKINVPERWRENGNRTILHIGACDYVTVVYVNGNRVGKHFGGYVSFSFDITDYLEGEENVVTIWVEDITKSGAQPSGKQSDTFHSRGCVYTRTTGIWQTVWLENVAKNYVVNTKYYPDLYNKQIVIEADVYGEEGVEFKAEAFFAGQKMGKGKTVSHGGKVKVTVPLKELYLWEVGCGRLYDLEITYGNDMVMSYFGMREIENRAGIVYINGKPIFQRLVLDQGFYPDGIYTAPTLQALENDIDMSMACGFNGARLHQKVFEPIFLSLCDKKGYIVWGEHANWGLDVSSQSVYESFLPEWMEILKRDFNHPSIIGWCPLNETEPDINKTFVKLLYDITKSFDTTRVFIDGSGWTHVNGASDIWDLHCYEQDPEKFKARLDQFIDGGKANLHPWRENQFVSDCTFVSEYGGIRWTLEESSGWGYGEAPTTDNDFIQRFKGLTEAILFHSNMGGLCYTQLTDVEQEVNGLYTYDRRPKFDVEIFREILTQPAAIEQIDETEK